MPSQFVVVVEEDEKRREEFRAAFGQHDDIAVFIEDSIFDACVKWLLLYDKGLCPRAVITSWHFCEEDAHIVDDRDGIFKSGAHFLLMQCAKLTDEGLLIVYTDDTKGATAGLAGSIEEQYVTVLSDKQFTVPSLILWLEEKHALIHAH